MQRNSVYILLISVAVLLAIGMVALYSTGAFAPDGHGDPFHFLKRQAVWLCAGIVGCVVAALFDYRRLSGLWLAAYAGAVVLLILCFVPGIGMELNGSHRWLNARVASFQPSELGKVAAILFLAHWFSFHEKRNREILRGFLYPMGIVGVLMALIACEVDLGTTSLICGTMVVMMFVGGTRFSLIALLVLLGISVIVLGVKLVPERLDRIMAFMDLERFKEGAGLQQYQGLIALGSGGVEGLGLGLGRQKMLYLPYAHTDFIFPMIGEELGLRFTLIIVFAYVLIFVSGACIAFHAADRFGLLLGFGIVVMLSLQAAVNIGVTTALLPNKGLPLPFISYGGSNLLLCLVGVGVLISIHRRGLPVEKGEAETMLRVRTRSTPRI